MSTKLPDAWLRGPVEGVPALLMPAAHAFIQSREDIERAAEELPEEWLWTKPGEAATLGFHLRHVVGSTGRLLLYSRGGQLDDPMRAAQKGEADPQGRPGESVRSLTAAAVAALDGAVEALKSVSADSLLEPREVGAAKLPTTVLGAIFHAAEHANRHAGQFVTTVKILKGNH
jgi:hypothetical protein